MAKQKVNINNTSIKSTVTNDPKKAICEYIWNGFDADAYHVSVNYEFDELGNITSLIIEDDGKGIIRSQLHDTFGTYQDSIKKKSYQWSSQVKGHKGKGRYSFNCFATRADWLSTYENEGQLFQHRISINAGENDHFEDHSDEGGQRIVHNTRTGTKVSFANINLSKEFFESDDLWNYFKREFAVFLKLNENREKSLSINDVYLDYTSLIAEDDNTHFDIVDTNNQDKVYRFNVTFIRWNEKMKENYSVYYLDENEIEHYERTTSLNRKDTDFHHSVYVVSSYFNNFGPSEDVKTDEELESMDAHSIVQQVLDFDGQHVLKNEKDKVFRELHKKVKDWLNLKLKNFIQDIAGEELWNRFQSKGVVSEPKNEYEEPLYYDLKETVKGIYSVQPKIFVNIGDDQAKALVGCLKLLLQTDKREDVLSILESITKMSDEERHRLVEILKVTELSHITNTIAMLENRLKSVSALKAMVFDEELKAYEVPDVQNVVSQAFWLFGEQYNIVTEAEPDFQQALEAYITKIHESVDGKSTSAINLEKIKHPDVNKEMDIFAIRQLASSNEIENIVVELKRPSVALGEIELSQIKNYMKLIYKEPQFNDPKAKWTFILVGNKLDSSGTIESEWETNKVWGKKGLVMRVDNNSMHYEIYVKTWSTVFAEFEMRHDFLMKRLNFKRDKLTAEYKNKEDLHNIVDSASEI